MDLDGTPYDLDTMVAGSLEDRLQAIHERMVQLRELGVLTPDTLRRYYGDRRFEQVAESNALEGSTLDVGETKLAVQKGFTLSGHDPAYVRDAIALNNALVRLEEMATTETEEVNSAQILEIHRLVLGERPGAGEVRNERVIITGSRHKPKVSRRELLDQLDELNAWSTESGSGLMSPVRSAVLHAWTAHIHPFIDGNGRTARAVGNLELLRHGYPPVIVKKRERTQYLECLAASDDGDLAPFLDFHAEHVDFALTALERAAQQKQAYDPFAAQLRAVHERELRVWNTAVELLSAVLESALAEKVEHYGGSVEMRSSGQSIDLEDYRTLIAGKPVSKARAFRVRLQLPGVAPLELLAWIGFRTPPLRTNLNGQGPALFWSERKDDVSDGRPWQGLTGPGLLGSDSSIVRGLGDSWMVHVPGNGVLPRSTTAFADELAMEIRSYALGRD